MAKKRKQIKSKNKKDNKITIIDKEVKKSFWQKLGLSVFALGLVVLFASNVLGGITGNVIAQGDNGLASAWIYILGIGFMIVGAFVLVFERK